MSMNPMQVAKNHAERVRKERQAALDEVLLRGLKPAYSTWTGKPSRVEESDAILDVNEEVTA
jgi:hypothetical protein